MSRAVELSRDAELLFVEPFYGGSHRTFADTLIEGIGGGARWSLVTLPDRHWKWRMRGSALAVAEQIAGRSFDLVFATSMLPLAELAGLAPQLARVPKVLYFHENQFAYPASPAPAENPERDFDYAFVQFAAAAAADACWFNSAFNRDSFLAGARALLRRLPDARPRAALERMEGRAEVFPLPLQLPAFETLASEDTAAGPFVLWNHRWEHDKNPDAFFGALEVLREDGVPFRLAVCGESYREQPASFERARHALADRIVHWGFCEDRAEYLGLLRRADLVVSTALQELSLIHI